MPLEKGTSRKVIERNIHEMVEHGHPAKQAVAAALHTAHPSGGKSGDNFNEEKTMEARKAGAVDAPEYQPVTATTHAEINAKNRERWENIGPADSEASAPVLAGTKVAEPSSVPVYRGSGMDESAEEEHEKSKDEVSPTQSDPPDARSDNLLHGHAIAGDKSLAEWAKEEEKEPEHKEKAEDESVASLLSRVQHKSSPEAYSGGKVHPPGEGTGHHLWTGNVNAEPPKKGKDEVIPMKGVK